jgi:hypothetical protein
LQTIIFFADQAAAPDGAVFTITRGGIDRFKSANSPAKFVTQLVVHLAAEPFDAGKYATELRILGPDGQYAADVVKGAIDVKLTGGRATMIVPLALTLSFGQYAAHFYLNGIRVAHCPFAVHSSSAAGPMLPLGGMSIEMQ